MKPGSDIEKNKNESPDNRAERCSSNDDNFAFVPAENIRIIERIIDNLTDAKQRLNRIRV